MIERKDMKSITTITSGIRQLDTLVSETNPINVVAKLRPQRSKPVYDMHFGFELGIVLAGVTRRYYPGYSHLIRPGQIWFCGMWEPHGYEVIEAPFENIVLAIWPPMLAQLRFEEAPEINWMAPFTIKPAARPQITPSKKKDLLEQAAQLKKLTAPATPAEKARIRICLLNILIMVSGLGPAFRTEKIKPRLKYWSRLNRAVQLVFESRAFVSTGQAAAACGLNRNIFSRLFKKWMGIRFADFALRFRIKLAASHLLQENEIAKNIADQLGFVDASHLNRLFWKYYGCSPSEFRRRHAIRN